jgi:hypothetical protein
MAQKKMNDPLRKMADDPFHPVALSAPGVGLDSLIQTVMISPAMKHNTALE